MDYSGYTFYPSPDPSNGPTSPQANTLGNTAGNASELGRQAAVPTRSPLEEEETPDDATVSLSFKPSLRFDDRLPDSIIVSSDHVYFYVHRHRITDASSNGFDGRFLLVQNSSAGYLSTILVPEKGDVVNVFLHLTYGLSCLHYQPTLETIDAALTALSKYGISMEEQATSQQPLYPLFLAHASYFPIDTFAVAACHRLEDIAVMVSSHLLTYDLSALSDELAIKMGPLYLKRLVHLHQHRLNALRNILMQLPEAHPATSDCGDYGRTMLTREWGLAAAQIVWDGVPREAEVTISPAGSPAAAGAVVDTAEESPRSDWLAVVGMSASTLRDHLARVGEAVSCEVCRQLLLERIQEAVLTWSAVKLTI